MHRLNDTCNLLIIYHMTSFTTTIAARHVRDRDRKMKFSRDQNKIVQLFNIQNSTNFHKSTVIRNDVMLFTLNHVIFHDEK